MDTALRYATAADTLANFCLVLEQGLHNARAAGSRVRMPTRVKITGFFANALNEGFVLGVQETPKTVVEERQVSGPETSTEKQTVPYQEIIETSVTDASYETAAEEALPRTTTRIRGGGTNQEVTTHPSQTSRQAKLGTDTTSTERSYREFAA